MRTRTQLVLLTLVALAAFGPYRAAAQEPIVEIPFESLPDGTLVQGAGGITLDGDVTVNQDLSVAGVVQSGAGIAFPDGTVQTTAAVEGASANYGLYNNRIVLMTPSQIYSEICFKSGQIFGDVHATSETTAGGSCVPGDRGLLIERNQRSAANWEDARLQCLHEGLRLPETFEWFVGCNNAATYGLNNMTGDWEWASNTAYPTVDPNGIAVHAAGLSGCNTGSWGFVGNSANGATSFTYRCLR